MTSRTTVIAGVIPLLAALGGCRGAAPTPSGEAFSSAELIAALEDAGAAVQAVGPVDQAFFRAPGQILRLSESEIQVFEYPDEAARAVDSASISSDGSSVGTTVITWVDRPTFWARGRLIVLSVGGKSGTLRLLSDILGEPVAQGRLPAS